jgi:hypothetical protein
MGNHPLGNAFREVHEKIQIAKDNLRKAKEMRADFRSHEAAEEAVREGFDRASIPTRVAKPPVDSSSEGLPSVTESPTQVGVESYPTAGSGLVKLPA